MRTTIRLDDDLFSELKQLAAASGRTLTSIIEDALRESLARRKLRTGKHRIRVPVFSGKGVQPGVDLDSSANLLDFMEESDAAH